jgi:putative lipoprotein
MRALLVMVALAACSAQPEADRGAPPAQAPSAAEAALARMPPWAEARAAGVDFRAVGQEPGWMLDIYTQDRIRLLWDYGEHVADFPLTGPAYPQEGATRYETRAGGRMLTIVIRRFPCQDAMSGEAYPAAVDIVIDGRELSGCGRSV